MGLQSLASRNVSVISRTKVITLTVISITIMVIVIFEKPKSQQNIVPAATVLGFLEHQSKTKQDAILKQLGHIQTAVESDSASWVKKSNIIFNAMHSLYDYVAKDKIRREIMDELLKDPQTIPMAHKILLDNAWTRQAYGKEQAVARVYAIALLERASELKGSQILLDTAQSLSLVLASQEKISKGEKADLGDVIYAYTKKENPETLLANLPQLISRLTVNPNTVSAIRDGFYFGLMGRVEDSEKMRQQILWYVR